MSAPLTVEAKLQEAIRRKEVGNEHFKAGQLKEAIRSYHEAILYMKGLDTTGNAFAGMATATGAGNGTLGAEQKETIKVQMSSVYANMAAVQLKLGEWNKAIKAAGQCLEIDDKNVKALFRRGQAHLNNNDLDQAEADFRKVLTIENDAAAKQELHKIKEKRKELERKSIKELSGMFSRGSLS